MSVDSSNFDIFLADINNSYMYLQDFPFLSVEFFFTNFNYISVVSYIYIYYLLYAVMNTYIIATFHITLYNPHILTLLNR